MGTSMASPHIAGVAALIVGSGVTDPDMVEKILKDTARKPNGKKYDSQRYGAGIVDAAAAVHKTQKGARGWELGLGLSLAAAVLVTARRRLSLGFVGAAVMGSSPVLLAGFPAWLAPNVLLYSAFVPLLLIGLGYGVSRLRGALAGFAVGVAGHLLFHALVPLRDVRWMAFDAVWLAANAAALVLVSVLVLRRE
jgi:serine protease